MTLGIIDLGTNSIHLLVGRLDRRGRWRRLLHKQELVRIGQGGVTTRRLTSRAIRRAFAVLDRYAAMLQRYGSDQVAAVATSAVRDAANGRAFARRVRQRLGLPLHVISGTEEARLIYQGMWWLHRFSVPTLVITIGGGSAQVMLGSGRRLRYAVSRPLGAARLAEQFIRHDPPRAGEVSALRQAVRRVWAPVARSIRRYRWQQALGGSATIAQVLAAAREFGAIGPAIRPTVLERLVRWLETSTATKRRRLPGLEPARQALALPTAVTLLEWMDACGVAGIRYAKGSLREGLVVETCHARRTRD